MQETKIYQTIQDKENPDEIERQGPFLCNWKNSWLGDGYYFWDTFIENAHWWGEVHCNNSYMICEAKIDWDNQNCFDLVGNTQHLLDFDKSIKFMKKKRLLKNDTTVSRVLKFMQNQNLFLNYCAIRAFGINSKGKDYTPNYRVVFEPEKKFQYLPYKPEIQFCLLKLDPLKFREYRVIFPDIYNPDYAV